MAVKTITIDMEAYDLLFRHKSEGQSFSEVIKSHFGRPLTAGEFKKRLRTMKPMSQDYLDRMKEVLADRKKRPMKRIEPLDSL
jgi:predicted CopG family antitoxin